MDYTNLILEKFSNIPKQDLKALFSIYLECIEARKKHPAWPNDEIHAAAIVSEEAGELVRAALQSVYEGGKLAHIQREAIQTAATCIRVLTESKKGGRDGA